MPLWQRIVREKRLLIIPLALAAVANAAAYGLWVYPLGVKSAGAADRAIAATKALQVAETEQAAARELVLSKSRADEELATFFQKVVPADFSAARRLTYATVPALAKKNGVKLVSRRYDDEPTEKNARLALLHVQTQWQCDYQSFRRFVHAVESDPAFVIIDDVVLTQGDVTKPLTLTLQLSTYYRLGADAK